MPRRQKTPKPTNPAPTSPPADLRERILADFATLQIPLRAEQLDTLLARAGREGLSHQQFLHLLIAEQANQRRERSIARRLANAGLTDFMPLSQFDWEFNKQAIDRTQIEELATGAFIARQDNLLFVGQSGVGKSFLVKAIGGSACALGYSVCYTTSADLLQDLTASLADQTLPKRLRHYVRPDLLIIDEFGFDHIERQLSPQAANLFFKIIDGRNRKRSTALATNIDLPVWNTYLGEPYMAQAFFDRIIDGAITLKINGKSYRAHRAQTATNPKR
jgi:DNA replication protein DnaC